MQRGLRRVVLAGLLAGLLGIGCAATAVASAAADTDGRRSLTGSIDGAAYRIEVPERWNGTLVLYSHGYYPPGFPSFGLPVTNRPPDRSETEAWLLEHGYALAASQFKEGGTGYQIESALQDQTALLDHFSDAVGRPRRTVATGQSLGATIAVLLAERNPGRFDGVATMCGGYDPQGMFNAVLDMNFAIKTLLAPGQDIDLVRAARRRREHRGARAGDPAGARDAAGTGAAVARRRVQQRRRLVRRPRAAAHRPHRVDPPAGLVAAERLRPRPRPGRAGGPRAQGGRQPVLQRRRRLPAPARAVGPQGHRPPRLQRGRAEPARRPRPAGGRAARLRRPGGGRLHVPLRRPAGPHAGARHHHAQHRRRRRGARPRALVRRAGPARRRSGQAPSALRRARNHCSFSAADELTELRTLFERIETGRWPDTSPERTNQESAAFGDPFSLVLDLGTFTDAPMSPAFTEFTPPQPLRPSR